MTKSRSRARVGVGDTHGESKKEDVEMKTNEKKTGAVGAPESGAPVGGLLASQGLLATAWVMLQPELSALPVEALLASPAEPFKAFAASEKLLSRVKKPELLARLAKLPSDEVQAGLVEAFEASIRAYQWVAIRPDGEEAGPKVDPELKERADTLYDRMYSVCAFTLEGNAAVEATLAGLTGKKSYAGLIKGLLALAEIETEYAEILADQKFKHRPSDPKDAVEVAEAVLAQVAGSEAAPEQLRRAFTHMRRLYEEVAAVLYFFERKHRDAHFVPTLRAATRARRRGTKAPSGEAAAKDGEGGDAGARGSAGRRKTPAAATSAASAPASGAPVASSTPAAAGEAEAVAPSPSSATPGPVATATG
jgi:hypothetical protein